MATLSDIAEKVNVSAAAVSRILNRDPEFVASRALRLAVMKKAVELGYRTPRQRKKSGSTLEIAIADWNSIPEARRDEFDYSMLVSLSDNKTAYIFTRLEKDSYSFVDAIIAVGSFRSEEIDEMLFSSTNIIFLNNYDNDIPFDKILIDYDSGVAKSIDYLLENGCRRIGFISAAGGDNRSMKGKERVEADMDILKKKGVFDGNLIEIGELNDESGYHMAENLMRKRPDAVILGSQFIEKGALKYLEALENPPLIILRREMELGREKTGYPAVRMASEQLWSVLHLLIYMRSHEPSHPLKVVVEAEFDPSHK